MSLELAGTSAVTALMVAVLAVVVLVSLRDTLENIAGSVHLDAVHPSLAIVAMRLRVSVVLHVGEVAPLSVAAAALAEVFLLFVFYCQHSALVIVAESAQKLNKMSFSSSEMHLVAVFVAFVDYYMHKV